MHAGCRHLPRSYLARKHQEQQDTQRNKPAETSSPADRFPTQDGASDTQSSASTDSCDEHRYAPSSLPDLTTCSDMQAPFMLMLIMIAMHGKCLDGPEAVVR